MDLRVLTKSGQKEIAKEIVDTSTIIDAIKQISTTDRANIFSFFKEVSKQYKVLNGVREEVVNSPELQAFLSSSTTTEAQRKEAMTLITLAVMKNLGYLPNDIKAIYTDERGYNGEEVKGFTSLQTGASYINFKNITNMKDLVKTITHENQRSMDIQDHRDINKNRDDDTKYASNFSDFATRYFSHALWLNDKGFSKTPLTTAVTSSMINNNREFAKLDKNLGVNRQLHHKEINLANLKGISQDEALKLLLMAGASMTDMLWNNSFDANSQDLAQAKEYLSQFKDQTYIDKDGKVQNYFVAKENDYTKPYINLYEAAFSGVLNIYDYLKIGITQSPYQGIMDKIKNATDHALNNKADTAKAVGSEIKNSLSDCANSPLKCSFDILQSIGNGIIDGTYGLAYNTMPSLANDLN